MSHNLIIKTTKIESNDTVTVLNVKPLYTKISNAALIYKKHCLSYVLRWVEI